ncbi:unnamed protein product [Sphenostylis stenocarpa]|uniref:HMA domain-containing protein n=1 Tax=Sphenostylis stenocarpa TaxID=92480 RepID=A0AA86VWL2_9FABA|nr:unnamed protein product [Sphenostylis stenocarpa]
MEGRELLRAPEGKGGPTKKRRVTMGQIITSALRFPREYRRGDCKMNYAEEMNMSEENKIEIKIGCACSGCKRKMKKALKGVKGVTDVQVERDTGKLTVIGHVNPDVVLDRVRCRTRKAARFWSQSDDVWNNPPALQSYYGNESNHGNYDNYDNHGNHGNYDNYDNHGNHGNYDNYNNHGNNGNHGNHGNYDNYDNYGNYSNYGNYGNYGNYDNYSNYGVVPEASSFARANFFEEQSYTTSFSDENPSPNLALPRMGQVTARSFACQQHLNLSYVKDPGHGRWLSLVDKLGLQLFMHIASTKLQVPAGLPLNNSYIPHSHLILLERSTCRYSFTVREGSVVITASIRG